MNGGSVFSVIVTAINPAGSEASPNNAGINPMTVGSPLLWVDANDPLANGTKPNNGSSITTWYDKSGLGNNAVANTGIVYNTTGLNNLPALTFTNTQWLLGPISITGSVMTVFAVVNMNASSTTYARILALAQPGQNDFDNNSYVGFLRFGNSNGVGPDRNNNVTITNPPSISTPYLFEMWFDGSNQFNTVQIGNSTTISSNASSGNFNVTSFAIGANTNAVVDSGSRFYGFMSEIIVYNVNLSNANRQAVEGYLSWKWGLQSNLPSSHPYYVVNPSSPAQVTTAGPSMPTSLGQQATSTTGFTVTWSNGTGATSYQYYINNVLTTPAQTTAYQQTTLFLQDSR